MHGHGRVLWFTLAALSLAACGRKDAAPLLPAADASHAQPAYLSQPQVLAVTRRPGGVIAIEGAALPDSRISGEMPDRKRYGATTGKNGRFSLEVPPSPAPELIAISEQNGRRELQTDGWLFVPPDAPERAVILRAGAPSRPLQSGLVAAVDVDAGGGAGVSGVTAPKAEVDVSVDRGTVVRAFADGRGVWGARLGLDKHVTSGAHQVRVTSNSAVVDRSFDFTVGATTQLFTPAREAGGWRVAWIMPGQGVQTTFLLVGASRS